jgi:hypothetical protein
MKKYVNGKYIEMTAEEVAAMEAEQHKYELAEKTRPFTAEEVNVMLIAQQINTLSVDDNTALRMVEFYPQWAENTAYTAGYKVQWDGKLWRCIQGHTAIAGWEPENTASLWEQINETHSGTVDDPIPYEGNMALEKGKHYVQDGVIYLCNRDTVNPVYNALSDLVGLYVVKV